MEKPELEKLNERQEKFCQLYTGEEGFFGNGVKAYLEVYDIDKRKPNWYKTACSAASQILTNIKVIKRINELLEEQGLNNEYVDKQLLFLIMQHSDFSSKLGAIKEYNKLKQRITEKTDITTGGEKLNKEMTKEELDRIINLYARKKDDEPQSDSPPDIPLQD